MYTVYEYIYVFKEIAIALLYKHCSFSRWQENPMDKKWTFFH